MSPINVRQVIRALIIKFASAAVVSIVVKMLFAVLAPHASNQAEDVFVSQISWAILIICVCHVSIRERKNAKFC